MAAKARNCERSSRGFRYTPTTTFETFPFPAESISGRGRGRGGGSAVSSTTCASAGRTRAESGISQLAKRTLTNLYNSPPTWLTHAHERLDRAVHGAYDWPYPLADDEILARLLELNLARTVAARLTRVSAE